jgi:CHAT domain-containing protein
MLARTAVLNFAVATGQAAPAPQDDANASEKILTVLRWDGREDRAEYRGVIGKVVVAGVTAESVLVLIPSCSQSSYVRTHPANAPLRMARPSQASPLFLVAVQPACDLHASFDAGGRPKPPNGPPYAASALLLKMPALAKGADAIRCLDERATAIEAALDGGSIGEAQALARDAALDAGVEPLGAAGLLAFWQLGYAAARAFVPEVAAAAFARGRALLEACLPPDHFALVALDMEAGFHLKETGHGAEARRWFEAAAERARRALEPADPLREFAEAHAADSALALGDVEAALALLEPLHERQIQRLDPDDPILIDTKLRLAEALSRSGRTEEAWRLDESLLKQIESRGPDARAAFARAELAYARHRSRGGDAQGAAELARSALRALSDRIDRDGIRWIEWRHEVANLLDGAGVSDEARTLREQVVDDCQRLLHEEHPLHLHVLTAYGTMLSDVGDREGARTWFERVVAIASRHLPDDHPYLQTARINLATAHFNAGRHREAAAIEDKVIEVYAESRPEDDLDLLDAMSRRAALMIDFSPRSAAAVLEHVLELQSNRLPATHDSVIATQATLASALLALDRAKDAAELLEAQLERLPLAAGSGDARRLGAQLTLLQALVTTGDREEIRAVAGRLAAETVREVRTLAPRSESRWLEQTVRARQSVADFLFLFALGGPELAPMPELTEVAFETGEELRDAVFARVRVDRMPAAVPRSESIRELRARLAEASRNVARAARDAAGGDALLNALRVRDGIENALRKELAARSFAAVEGPQLTAEVVRAAIPAESAVVAFRWQRLGVFVRRSVVLRTSDWFPKPRLLATIVRRERPTELVDLGAIARIEAAVSRWRRGLDADSGRGAAALSARDPAAEQRVAGEELASLLLQPLRPALEGASVLIVLLDDPLFLVPLDALPMGEGLAGDRLSIRVVPSLGSIVNPPASGPARGAVTLVGGVDYGEPGGSPPLALLRGSPFGAGFRPLPATLVEVQGIESVARSKEELEASGVRVVTGAAASRRALLDAAASTRLLHLATHGFYAPESVPSAADERYVDADLGIGTLGSQRERVGALSPMVLCGLALAGANAVADALGAADGLITAEEIAALDLSSCELAVLSACETALGERRANQAVASLQKALHLAGARSAITSLWKVPDDATQELMTDFYRRLWIEKQPKQRALWEAKRRLREQRSPDGSPRYALRDWAAWVLSGEPD